MHTEQNEQLLSSATDDGIELQDSAGLKDVMLEQEEPNPEDPEAIEKIEEIEEQSSQKSHSCGAWATWGSRLIGKKE